MPTAWEILIGIMQRQPTNYGCDKSLAQQVSNRAFVAHLLVVRQQLAQKAFK